MWPYAGVLSAVLLISAAPVSWAKRPETDAPTFEELPASGIPSDDSTQAGEAPKTAAPDRAVPSTAADSEAPAKIPSENSTPAANPGTPDLEEVPAVKTPPPAVHPKPFKPYKVWIWQENGDCLWRIAEKVYGDRHKWRLIYLANKNVIKDPNKIYPKQKLLIPPVDWQP